MANELNRGENLFNKMISGIKFQDEIKEIRKAFEIPDGGFLDNDGISSWYFKGWQTGENQIRINKFNERLTALLGKWVFPDNNWWHRKITEYIVCQERIPYLQRSFPSSPFVEIAERKQGADMFKSGSFTDLRIYEGASQRDIFDFIKKHWKTVIPCRRFGVSKKIQPERYPKETKKIMELWKNGGGKDGKSKEMIIVQKIKEITGNKLQPEAVKMRAHRKRNPKR